MTTELEIMMPPLADDTSVLASRRSWRTHPCAILPPAFFLGFTSGLLELPINFLLSEVGCVNEDDNHRDCGDPFFPQNGIATIYRVVLTVVTILVAGLYGRISDIKSRKKAMGTAAAVKALGDLWILLPGM